MNPQGDVSGGTGQDGQQGQQGSQNAGYTYPNQSAPQVDFYNRQATAQNAAADIPQYTVDESCVYPQNQQQQQQPFVNNPQDQYYSNQPGYYQPLSPQPQQQMKPEQLQQYLQHLQHQQPTQQQLLQDQQHQQPIQHQQQHQQQPMQQQQQPMQQQQLLREQQHQQLLQDQQYQQHRPQLQYSLAQDHQQIPAIERTPDNPIPLERTPSSQFLSNKSNPSTGFTPTPYPQSQVYSNNPNTPFVQEVYASAAAQSFPQQTYAVSSGQIQPNPQAVNYCTSQSQTTYNQQGIQSRPTMGYHPGYTGHQHPHPHMAPDFNMHGQQRYHPPATYTYSAIPSPQLPYTPGIPSVPPGSSYPQNYSSSSQAYGSITTATEQSSLGTELGRRGSQNALTRTKSQLSLRTNKQQDPAQSQ